MRPAAEQSASPSVNTAVKTNRQPDQPPEERELTPDGLSRLKPGDMLAINGHEDEPVRMARIP